MEEWRKKALRDTFMMSALVGAIPGIVEMQAEQARADALRAGIEDRARQMRENDPTVVMVVPKQEDRDGQADSEGAPRDPDGRLCGPGQVVPN